MGKSDRHRLLTVITGQQYRWLKAAGKRLDRSVASVVRMLIDSGIEETQWVDPGPGGDETEEDSKDGKG